VVGCCEHSDELSGSGITRLGIWSLGSVNCNFIANFDFVTFPFGESRMLQWSFQPN
jgi:hypothetical protein